MSYDEGTGWTKVSSRQAANYCRAIPPTREAVEQRLAELDVDYYWDTYNGLHARCQQGQLWEILSGLPSGWNEGPRDQPTEQEWISVTTLGAVFSPPATTATVLRLLREEGLLERVDGKDRPTSAAQGLYVEREAEISSRFKSRPGAIQRLWAYPVVVRLRSHREAVDAVRKERDASLQPPKVFSIELRFPAACDVCGRDLALGERVRWASPSGELSCEAHGLSPAASGQESS